MKLNYSLSKYCILLFSLFFAFTLVGQDQNLSKKEQKRKASDEKLKEIYKVLKSRQFIIEANGVFGNSGDTYNVNPSINFFFVDSSSSTIQLSFDGLIGWNGVGGVTVDGNIDKYDLKELKSGKPITLIGSIIGRIGGNLQFTMYVNSSGMATVEVNGNWGSRITFQGRLFTLADSKVFKGIPLN